MERRVRRNRNPIVEVGLTITSRKHQPTVMNQPDCKAGRAWVAVCSKNVIDLPRGGIIYPSCRFWSPTACYKTR